MLKKIIGKSEITFTIFRYLTYGIQIIRGLFIAKILGPFHFGVFGYAILLQQYLMYSSLGVQHLLNAELAISKGRDHQLANRNIGVAFFLTTIINFFLFITGILIFIFDIPLFSGKVNSENAILLLVLAVLINYQQLFLNIFRVYLRLKEILLVEVIVVIATIIPLFFYQNEQLIYSYFAFWIFISILAIIFFYLQSPVKIFFLIDFKQTLIFLNNSLPYYLYSLSFFLINLISRTFIANHYSTSEMGFYSFANYISTAVMLGFDTITWLIFPKVVNAFSDSSLFNKELEKKINSISRPLNLVVFFCIIFIIIVLPNVYIFYPEYSKSGNALSILLIAQAVVNSGFALSSLYISRKQYFKLAFFSTSGLLVTWIFSYFFVKLNFNFEWIGFAAMLGYFTFINLLNWKAAKDFKLNFSTITNPFNFKMQVCILLSAVFLLLGLSKYSFLFFILFFVLQRSTFHLLFYSIKNWFNCNVPQN